MKQAALALLHAPLRFWRAYWRLVLDTPPKGQCEACGRSCGTHTTLCPLCQQR